MLLVTSLAALTVWADAGNASAQVFVRRGGNIVYGDGNGNYGYGGSYLPFGGAFLPYGGANLPDVYAGPAYTPAYPGYTPNYYDAAPLYPAPPMRRRQAYYVAPVAAQQFARMTVLLPTADAQVWFDNTATSQTGMKRSFDSPPLEANHRYTYTVKARWLENGKVMDQERQVHVQMGQNVTVNFHEIVPLPLTQVPAPTQQN
jgi:uncharacterized protein (TIGR03000 family)